MKKLLFLLAVFMFIAGCQKEDVILNTEGDQIQKGKVFNISGFVDGVTTWPFGANAPFRHLEGTGQLNPGGSVQVVMDYLIGSFDPGTMTGTSAFGSAEIITQNGDKMYAINGAGTFSITGTMVSFTATADISGGSGEFDNVMGTITYIGSFNQLDGVTHAEWTGTFTREKPIAGSFTGENQTVTGSCLPGYSRRLAVGSGNMSHLGKINFSLEHCVNFTTGLILSGSDVLQAPNGDKLFVSHNGYCLPIPGSTNAAVTMFATITGGEGRFENASGYMWLKAIQTMPAGDAQGTCDGVIKY
jgi:hypothetical protein